MTTIIWPWDHYKPPPNPKAPLKRQSWSHRHQRTLEQSSGQRSVALYVMPGAPGGREWMVDVSCLSPSLLGGAEIVNVIVFFVCAGRSTWSLNPGYLQSDPPSHQRVEPQVNRCTVILHFSLMCTSLYYWHMLCETCCECVRMCRLEAVWSLSLSYSGLCFSLCQEILQEELTWEKKSRKSNKHVRTACVSTACVCSSSTGRNMFLTSFVGGSHQWSAGCVNKAHLIPNFLPVGELLRCDVFLHLNPNRHFTACVYQMQPRWTIKSCMRCKPSYL